MTKTYEAPKVVSTENVVSVTLGGLKNTVEFRGSIPSTGFYL